MKKTIEISAKSNEPLNNLADYILDHGSDFIDLLQNFELVAGRSAKLGGGEPEVRKIRLTGIIENPQSNDSDLDKLLELFTRYAKEREIELVFDEKLDD